MSILSIRLMRETGMRKIAICITMAFVTLAAYAGDVATFVNLGFSADGGSFAFGQYGVTDGDYRAYADLFCVDVAKNDFVKGGKFSVAPSQSTVGKDGRGTFASLQNKAASFIGTLRIDSSSQGRAIYAQAEDAPSVKELSFRDFENGREFAVTLKSLSDGSGSSVRSSFYLLVVITDANGVERRYTVGLPGFARSGVKDYQIRRILTDQSGKSIVFVIEKELAEKRGNSLRFMVETLRL